MPAPLAEKHIPNVGRLVAYSDNKVHAVFYDGITLNMVWDFSSRCGKSQVSLVESQVLLGLSSVCEGYGVKGQDNWPV